MAHMPHAARQKVKVKDPRAAATRAMFMTISPDRERECMVL